MAGRDPAIHVFKAPYLEVADTLSPGHYAPWEGTERMNDAVSQDLVDKFVAHWSQSSGAAKERF
jgi:hypothetical protein